jgi:prepilin-type N-terminal cleavage/methylation domain-containing protein
MRSDAAGFTLIEVLVALAVCGALVAAMSPIFGWNIMQSRLAETRLSMAAAERSLLEALPDRDKLKAGSASGSLGDIVWHMNVSPIRAREGDIDTSWLPYRINVQMLAPDGMTGGFETIRLGRKEP